MEPKKPSLPIIIESETSNLDKESSFEPSLGQSVKKSTSWFGRIIFGILGTVILVELIVGIKMLNTPIPVPGEVQAIGGGKLLLIAADKDYAKSEVIPVTIGASTGTDVSEGIDVVIKYDPRFLEATSGAFIRGSIFPEYLIARIDQQNGTIEVSGVPLVGQSGFLGTGVFGKLNFKALSQGKTEVKFDYTQGKTNDSNIISANDSKDILEQVTNLKLNIR